MSTTIITAPLTALAAIFTPSCSISWLLTTTKDPSQYPSFPTTGPASCDPPDWAANIAGKGFQYYSPAICPSGFEVGPGCQITKTRTAEGFPTVRAGETAVYCVPSGQSCTTDTTDFRGGVWGATSNDGNIFTVGPALQIRFQQSDLSILETHPLTPGLTLSFDGFSGLSVSAGASAGAVATSTSATFSSEVSTRTATPATTPELTVASTVSAGKSTAGGVHSTSGTISLPSQNPASDAAQNGIQNEDSVDAGLIAVVISALLATFAVCLFVIIRIRRQGGSWLSFSWNPPGGLVPVGLGAWTGRPISDEEQLQGTSRSVSDQEVPVELESETGPTVEPLRFERPLLGSKENPAELEGFHDQRLSQRESWISRMLSIVTRSSTTTRSSSRSRWTSRSLARSDDWERLVHEKIGKTGDGEPGAPMLPDITYPRPITMSSDFNDGDDTFDKLSHTAGIVKVRSFDRLSEGTFGRVIVRGRSSGSSQSRKA